MKKLISILSFILVVSCLWAAGIPFTGSIDVEDVDGLTAGSVPVVVTTGGWTNTDVQGVLEEIQTDINNFVATSTGLYTTAFSSGWDGVDTLAPTVNIVYDEIVKKQTIGTTYYVTQAGSGDGTGSSYANSMSMTTFGSSTFKSGGQVYLSDTITQMIDIPSSGQDGLPIVYRGDLAGHPCTVDVRVLISSWTTAGAVSNKTGVSSCRFVTEDDVPLPVATSSACTDGNWYHTGTTLYYKPTTGVYSDHTVKRSSATRGIDINGQSHIIIKGFNVNYVQTGIAGIEDTGLPQEHDVTVEGNTLTKCANGIVMLIYNTGGISDSIRIKNNTLINCGRGINLSSNGADSGEKHTNCYIGNNTIINNGRTSAATGNWTLVITTIDPEAISFQNLNSSTIAGNKILGGLSYGIFLYTETAGTTDYNIIKNNYIKDTSYCGLLMLPYGPATSMQGNSIIGNTIEGCGKSYHSILYGSVGLSAVTTPTTVYNSFSGNKVSDGDELIYLLAAADYWKITNNTLKDAGNYYIDALGSPSNVEINFNEYDNGTTGTKYAWGNTGYNLDNYKTASSQDANSLVSGGTADPTAYSIGAWNSSTLGASQNAISDYLESFYPSVADSGGINLPNDTNRQPTGGLYQIYVDNGDFKFNDNGAELTPAFLENVNAFTTTNTFARELRFGTGAWSGDPSEGDLGYDGTHLYFKPSGTVVDLLAAAPTQSSLHIDDILTTIGVASEATHLGTFTGTTIADSSTVKASLQALETALELVEGASVGPDLTAIEALATSGGAAFRTASNTWTLRAITAGTGITVTNGDGIAGAPSIAVTGSTYQGLDADLTSLAAGMTSGGITVSKGNGNGYGVISGVTVDSSGIIHANGFVSAGTGDSYIELGQNASGYTATSGYQIYFDNGVLKVYDGEEKTIATGATGATAWDDIGDPDAAGSIAFAGFMQTLTSTLNTTGAVLTVTNTTADLGYDVSFIDLKYTDNNDPNGFFMRGYDNASTLQWSIANGGNFNMNTLHSASGKGAFHQGCVFNDAQGNAAADDFVVKTNTIDEAFLVEAGDNLIRNRVPLYIDTSTATTGGIIQASDTGHLDISAYTSIDLNSAVIMSSTLDVAGGSITLQNDEVISNATDTEIEFDGDEDLTIDLDTATDNQVVIKSDTGVTELSFSALNLITTGTLQGLVPMIHTTGGITLSASQCLGSMVIVSTTQGIALPAAATAGYGSIVVVRARDAEVTTIDPNGSEVINLSGAALTGGYKIKSSGTAGDQITLISTTDTGDGSTDGWIDIGKSSSTAWVTNGS